MPYFLRSYFYPQIPNALTSFRIVVAWVIGYFAMLEYLHDGPQRAADVFFHDRIVAFVLFVFIAVPTEYLDGDLARRNGWVTKLGEFLDPFADKLLAIAVLGYVWVVFSKGLHLWLFVPTVLFIAAYSVVTTLLRVFGYVAGASPVAKNKTGWQMAAMGIFLFAAMFEYAFPQFAFWMLWIGMPVLVYSAWLCWPSLMGYLHAHGTDRVRDSGTRMAGTRSYGLRPGLKSTGHIAPAE